MFIENKERNNVFELKAKRNLLTLGNGTVGASISTVPRLEKLVRMGGETNGFNRGRVKSRLKAGGG